MKDKCWGFILLSFVPPFLILFAFSSGFNTAILPSYIVVAMITQALLLILLWRLFVSRPVGDFIRTIHRAIRGDYRARFSCNSIDYAFTRLSISFNQLMNCVESQMNELSENRILQNQLYENEKIYRSALELTCERVFEADLSHNRLLYGTDIYCKRFPFLHTEIYDEMIHLIAKNAVCDEDSEKFCRTFSRDSLMEKYQKNSQPEVDMEYRQTNQEGQMIWYSASVVFLNTLNHNLKIIGYVKNIDERKKQEMKILDKSQKDPLTCLYNKGVTQELIDRYLQSDGHEKTSAVIMVDIDHFKHINDTYGHTQGDVALTEVSRKLLALFRSSDIVGRVGGDEFLVLMKDVTNTKALLDKLHSIGSYFSQIRLEDPDFRISGSIGVSLYPEDGKTYCDLFKKSDIALYHSKEHGRNQFYFYGGRYGNEYGAVPEVNELDEKDYIPHIKPIDNSTTVQQ